jgi:N-acetylglucosamine kinase-like BadF-type ATPase
VTDVLPAVLAVDGGNSKTDVTLVARDGRVLALVRGPGMPGRMGSGTVQIIGDLVRSAVERAGTGSDAAGRVADHLVACVANADLPSDERELERMLADEGWTATTMVANDTYAVLRAGLDDEPAAGAEQHWGVGLTCGAGINCIGKAPDGRTEGFLALGEITGDWGGGGELGRKALWNAARAFDGRGPQTVLAQAVPEAFGLKDPNEVAEALFKGRLGPNPVVSLAPVVLAAADAGDEVARGLVLRNAQEMFLMVKSTITRLGLTDAPVPVVLGGGMVASGNPLLLDTVTSLIRTEFPAAEIRLLADAPVAGASLMGLDLAGASVQAKQRLRAEFASSERSVR